MSSRLLRGTKSVMREVLACGFPTSRSLCVQAPHLHFASFGYTECTSCVRPRVAGEGVPLVSPYNNDNGEIRSRARKGAGEDLAVVVV